MQQIDRQTVNEIFQLGAIFILRKGKGVGGWYVKILTIPYRGRWVVLDHPYVRKKRTFES